MLRKPRIFFTERNKLQILQQSEINLVFSNMALRFRLFRISSILFLQFSHKNEATSGSIIRLSNKFSNRVVFVILHQNFHEISIGFRPRFSITIYVPTTISFSLKKMVTVFDSSKGAKPCLGIRS